ncbi:WYL domain-containing protein [Bifidobacterium sp. 79T10]|nr:WYL domain-containing protein [Bifidobacterium saguinibicoloris]
MTDALSGDHRRVAGRQGTQSTAQTVVEILELLDRHTDREHGVSAAWIAGELGVNEKTVRTHLKTLEAMTPFGRKVGRIERHELAHAESADPRPGWYIEPVFDTAQMRLLTDGALMSRSDGDYLRDLVAKIYSFAGRSGQLRGLAQLDTPKNYNTEFLNNIELLNDAIAHERAITFHYCTYDMDGNLVPRRSRDGGMRLYHADPYDLRYKNNKYYLVCHMRPYKDLSYLHVERFRDLSISGEDHSLERTLDSFSDVPGEPFDIARHMDERPYPVKGKAVPIHLRIKKNLEPLYDWFEDAQVERIGDDVWDVHIRAGEQATLWWVLQYAESGQIEVLAPEHLRAMLRTTGKKLKELYSDHRGESGDDAASDASDTSHATDATDGSDATDDTGEM